MCFYNIITSIPLPIVVFLLGLLAAFIIKQWQLKSKIESNQRFVIYWINAIKEAVEKQVIGFEDYANEIKRADPKLKGLTRVNLHIDKLKAITPVEMVQTFVTNKRTKKSIKLRLLYLLTSDIDHIDNLQVNSLKLLEGCSDIALKNNAEWELRITDLNNWFMEIYKKHGVNLPTNPFLKEVYALRNEWINTIQQVSPEDSKPVEWTKVLFLNKVEPILQKYSVIDPANVELLELTSIASRLNNSYTRRILNMEKLSLMFSELGKDMQFAYNRLNLTKTRIDKLKFKFFLFLN